MQINFRIIRFFSRLSERKYSLLIISALAFIESIFSAFPFTIIFTLLVISNPKKAYTYAFLSTAIAVLGAAVGYAIGHYAWLSGTSEPTAIANFFFTYVPGFNAQAYTHIQGLYQQWGFLIIFTAGFAPVPFELITITSGVFNINFVLFLIGAAIGRGIRYFVIAFFIVRYGRKFVLFVKKYTKPIIWGVSATAIVAIIIVKMFL